MSNANIQAAIDSGRQGALLTDLLSMSDESDGTGTAAPTTDEWEQGDYVRNSLPAVGQPKGWVCTVSGEPGTWVSTGNL